MLEQKDFSFLMPSAAQQKLRSQKQLPLFSLFTTALIMFDERWSLHRENTNANVVSCERRQNNFIAINLSVTVICGQPKNHSV